MNYVERASDLPLHVQLKKLIRAQIEQGELPVGSCIASEHRIQKKYCVSRATVRHALEELINEGLLYRRPGIITVVGLPKIRPELVKLTSFTEDLLSRGLQPTSVTLSAKHVPAPEEIQNALRLQPGDEVWKVLRLRSANAEPIGVHELYVLVALGLTQAELENLSSFYELINQKLRLAPERGFESLTAAKASGPLTKLLRVKIGDPLLAIRRTTFAQTGVAFEFVKMTYRADRYEYHAVLRR